MKIQSIRTWNADLGNKRPYTIAFKTIDEVRNAFVLITLENGLTGIGAGNPSEYVTGESFEDCLAALTEERLSFLVGRDLHEFYGLLSEVQEKLGRTPAACAAVDIALHDAFTKSLQVPLVKFLGQQVDALPTSITIGIKNVEETIRDAEEYLNVGFRILKIKLGKDLEEDIGRLVRLREVYGPTPVLRIDANQGYNPKQAMEFFRRTRLLNLELIEQPLPANAVDEMRSLPGEVRTRLAADESLLTAEDAIRLLSPAPACGIFNIKLMKCGGIHEARKIAAVAESSGIDLFWGCNDESIVSITAALHTAYASPHTRYIDLDGSLDLVHDVVEGGFILRDGLMYCSSSPGLGVVVR